MEKYLVICWYTGIIIYCGSFEQCLLNYNVNKHEITQLIGDKYVAYGQWDSLTNNWATKTYSNTFENE